MTQSQPSLEERKGDARIYFLTSFFFSCIVCGGVFLGLYIFLPSYDTESGYPFAGLFLEGVPWIFWLLTYIYRCIRPNHNNTPPGKSVTRSTGGDIEASSAIEPTNPSSDESHLNSNENYPNDGTRRVHFGGVVVISHEYNANDHNNEHHDEHEEDEHEGVESRSEAEHGYRTLTSHEGDDNNPVIDSRVSETPLTVSG